MNKHLTFPISDDDILALNVGDSVLLSGVMITGRDAVHKWLADTFIKKTRQPTEDDLEVYRRHPTHPGWRRHLPLRSGGGRPGHQTIPFCGSRSDHQHP